jgi:hypothetical protein
MKKINLFFLLVVFATSVSAQGKRINLPKNPDNGFIFTTTPYQLGDTVVLRASLNPWSYLYLGGINGTKQKPVVIINEGPVEMSSGIDLENCRYIKLTGSGSRDKYGIRVLHSDGVALGIHGKSSDIEAERFSAVGCSFGCWIKNEANCDTSINNWVLDRISVHDYEFRDIKIEGFYMGSTDANNASRPINCNGVQQFYRPSKLGNIKIYNGFIDGTGRPAIQLSNAQVGMSEIYNNTISNVGRERNDQQGTGISLGLYTRAWVHHNKISNTLTWGIASLGGSGTIRIENNTIDHSGQLGDLSLNWAQNIVIDTRATDPADSTRFIIVNNEVDHPGKDVENIEVWQSVKTYGSDNLICNNTVHGKPAGIRVADGISWRNCNTWQKGGNSFPWWWPASGAVVLVILLVTINRKKIAHKKKMISQLMQV